MSRWMMWALLGMIVMAMVVAGCDNPGGGVDNTPAEFSARNTVTNGQAVDVHMILNPNPGTSVDTSGHVPDIANLEVGGTPPSVPIAPGKYTVVFTVAGTDLMIAYADVNVVPGANAMVELACVEGNDPFVIVKE